jgi:uncharacterized protein YydD (DUF2326 family)
VGLEHLEWRTHMRCWARWRELPPYYKEAEDNKLPWVRTWTGIYKRCNYRKEYIRRGIKNEITPAQLRRLWIRDGADRMKKPSIDRKNSLKDYDYKNCRYVEHVDNCKHIMMDRNNCSQRSKKLWKDPAYRKKHLNLLAKAREIMKKKRRPI